MHWFFAFLLSLSVVALLMPIFIRLMERYRILDQAGGRKIHDGYTAHMGGIVIFLGFIVSCCFSMFYIRSFVDVWSMGSLLILLSVIVIVGVRDDMNNLTPLTKLLFEIAIGVILCVLEIRLKSFYGFCGIYELPLWVSYLLTVFFFIVVANSYNLIDGIDGQAGLLAVATFGFLCLFLWQMLSSGYGTNEGITNPFFWLMIIASMLGAIIGFLFYNWQKASIFMGDTGSLFIGFMMGIAIIATMNLSGQYGGDILGLPIQSKLAVILSFFFLPLADTLRVFITRIKKGKSPFYPDKTHIHHFLLRIKHFSHAKCAIILFCLQIFVSSLVLGTSLFLTDTWMALVLLLLWILYVLFVRLLVKKNINNSKI